MPLKNGKRSEAEEQSALFEWAKYIKELKYMFAIPNGGSRNKIEAVNLKRQGVKAGVSDIFLPLSRGDYHGLFIEMKVGKNKASDAQKEFLEYVNEMGYYGTVCYGFDEAQKTILWYIGLQGGGEKNGR